MNRIAKLAMTAITASIFLAGCEKELTQEERMKKIQTQIEEMATKIDKRQMNKSEYETCRKNIEADLKKLKNADSYVLLTMESLKKAADAYLSKEERIKKLEEADRNNKIDMPEQRTAKDKRTLTECLKAPWQK